MDFIERNMNKKISLLLALVIMLSLVGCSQTDVNLNSNSATENNQNKEYTFTPDPQAANSSRLALADIQKNPDALTYQKNIIPINDGGQYNNVDQDTAFYTVGTTKYTLKLINDDLYGVYDGETKLFEHRMCWPADQADGSPELISVNNKLAVRFFDCTEQLQTGHTTTSGQYTTDIYYDGQFINKTHSITNTSFIFVYNDKIGFIADADNATYVFYDGQIVSAPYKNIFTKNCCALNELTPTLYEDGILAIYGKKDTDSIIAEIKLE